MNRFKQKGKRFEDKVAYIIQQKWKFPNGSVLRASTSGIHKYEFGDIKFSFPFVIPLFFECKNRESWKYTDMLYFKGNIRKWYIEAVEGAGIKREKYNIPFYPILVFTKRYQPIFIAHSPSRYRDDIKDFLNKKKYSTKDLLRLKHHKNNENKKNTKKNGYNIFQLHIKVLDDESLKDPSRIYEIEILDIYTFLDIYKLDIRYCEEHFTL